MDVIRGVNRGAALGGLCTAAAAVFALWSSGWLTGWEARHQLEAAQPTIRFLCSTIVAVAATVLALMVTALSLGARDSATFNAIQVRRLRVISLLCTICLTMGIVLLMVLTVPFAEGLDISGDTYAIFYYGITGGSALLAGFMVTMIWTLHRTLGTIIEIVHPSGSADLRGHAGEDADPSEADASDAEADPSGGAAYEDGEGDAGDDDRE